jgi:uncharacterized protein involved in copper resistance
MGNRAEPTYNRTMFGIAWRHAVLILQIALLSGIFAAAPGEEMQHDHAQTDHSAIDHSQTDHSKMDHAMPGPARIDVDACCQSDQTAEKEIDRSCGAHARAFACRSRHGHARHGHERLFRALRVDA